MYSPVWASKNLKQTVEVAEQQFELILDSLSSQHKGQNPTENNDGQISREQAECRARAIESIRSICRQFLSDGERVSQVEDGESEYNQCVDGYYSSKVYQKRIAEDCGQ